jgi:hypothetical protein
LSSELLQSLYKAAEQKLRSQEGELKTRDKLELIFGKQAEDAAQGATAEEPKTAEEGDKLTVKELLMTN